MSVKKRQSILLGTVIMCATFVLISISWAAFSSTLTVGGNADISAQSWDIDFTNTVNTKWTAAQKLTGTSTSLAELPASTDTSAFSLPKDGEASGFLGTLKMSGDKITYTWYVQNFGTLDATYSIDGVIATSTYASGSNVDITCNTSDNSTDKTFCNNYVKTTVTVDGDVTTPTSSYSLGKAGSATDHATVVLTIEITGTDQIYTGTLANHYDNNTHATLLSNIQKLGSSNGDLNISIKGLKLTEKQDGVSTSEEITTTTTSPYNQYINKTWTYSYTGSYQEFDVPYPGNYKIELWGAGGGSDSGYYFASGEKNYGGYTSGQINLDEGTKLYVYVGQEAQTYQTNSDGSFNGGGAVTTISKSSDSNCGSQGTTGGGATDVRLVSGDWNNSTSLASRIMVAGGAGGIGGFGTGGYAGGLNSYAGSFTNGAISGNHTRSTQSAASQTSGGAPDTASSSNVTSGLSNTSGSFGTGGRGAGAACMGAGGGGGYYGGGGSYNMGAGSGGSSYISGHTGSVAITSASSLTPRNDSNGSKCADGTTDITCSYHYSGYVFTNTSIIDGEGYSWTTTKGSSSVGMPTQDGSSSMTGNTGNGYAKITYLGED